MRIVNAHKDDTVDRLVWRHYGHTSGAIVEAVLAANPGLAKFGSVLPHGTTVTLPDITPAPQKRITQLWD